MHVLEDTWTIILAFCKMKTVHTLSATSHTLLKHALDRAKRTLDSEVDKDIALFFPNRFVSIMGRAWFAEKPRRLNDISNRRWKQLQRQLLHKNHKNLMQGALRMHRLSRAIRGGDLSQVRLIWVEGTDLNSLCQSYGFHNTSPFQLACQCTNETIIKWMLKVGGDPYSALDFINNKLMQLNQAQYLPIQDIIHKYIEDNPHLKPGSVSSSSSMSFLNQSRAKRKDCSGNDYEFHTAQEEELLKRQRKDKLERFASRTRL